MANLSLGTYYSGSGTINNKVGGDFSLRNAYINGFNPISSASVARYELNDTFGTDTNNCSLSYVWGDTTNADYYTFPISTDRSLRFKFQPYWSQISPSSGLGLFDDYDDPTSGSFPGVDAANSSLEFEAVTNGPGYTSITSSLGGSGGGFSFNGSNQRCRLPTVASNTSYTSNNGNDSTWAAWIYFGELRPGSFKYIWANNQEIGSTVNYYGTLMQQSSAGDGIIVMLHGNGGGTASGNRRSYVSSANTIATGWHLVCLWTAGNTTSYNSTGTNRIMTTAASAGTPNTTDRISTLTGTGTNLVYTTSYRYCLGQFSNGGYFDGYIGHQWHWNEHIAVSDYEALYNATYEIYTP